MGWTDERVDLLTKLWQDGLSASQISKQLGGVTRNAVIGKVHRLGLSGRGAPSKPQSATFKSPRPVRPRTPKPVRPPQRPAAVVHDGRTALRHVDEGPGTATCLTLGAHMCKWPIGDPLADSFTYCGDLAEDGPYCVKHCGVAYQPASAKKSSAAELARSLRRYI